MTDQFVGEIRIFPFNFAPLGWAFCEGQLLSITQNTALFSLLGTVFGGNGTTTYGLPNLQGSAPMNWGAGAGLTPRDNGEPGGVATVTLQQSQIPTHSHALQGTSNSGTSTSPSGNLIGQAAIEARKAHQMYATATANVQMLSGNIGATGGGGAHNNLQPFLTLNFCIALVGYYPPRG